MTKETLITSSGIIRNRSLPRTGIVNANSLYDDLFQDCLNDGIDLTWEAYLDELQEQLKTDYPDADDAEFEELLQEASEQVEFESRAFLLGAWVKDEKGEYIIDKSGKHGNYALSYNTGSGNVAVEWSILTTSCNNTSPCYVMSDGSGPCGDLNTPGNSVIAYTLPADMFRKDNE